MVMISCSVPVLLKVWVVIVREHSEDISTESHVFHNLLFSGKCHLP